MSKGHKVYLSNKMNNRRAFDQLKSVVDAYSGNKEMLEIFRMIEMGTMNWTIQIVDDFIDCMSNALMKYGIDASGNLSTIGIEIDNSISYFH